jgi:tRNA G37 N-methylase TrmD
LLSNLGKLVDVPEVLLSLHHDLVSLWVNVSKLQSTLYVSRFASDLLRVFASD